MASMAGTLLLGALAMHTNEPPIAVNADAALRELLVAAVAQNEGFGGGVMRVESSAGVIYWEGAAGVRMHQQPGPMAASDTFEIASITKVFTAVVTLQFCERFGIDLDSPVASWAPPHLLEGLLMINGIDYSDRITWRQLLGHRSGLAHYWNCPPYVDGEAHNAFMRDFLADPNRFWSGESILAYARGFDAVALPGQCYHYADTNYVILGLLLESLTGRPLHDTFTRDIFVPLGMHDTYMRFRQNPSTALALSSRYEDELDVTYERRQSADWAGGGLVSTTADLIRFARGLARGLLFVEPQTLRAMQTWLPTGEADVAYGLGLFHIALTPDDEGLWGHDGHGNAFMYVHPTTDLIFAGTLNQTDNTWWTLVSASLDVLAAALH